MIKSSQKVFDVLEYLCVNGSAKASEVSQALDLQKSSVHRFLNTLVDIGFVRKDEVSNRFSATLKVYQLGIAVSNHIDLLSHAKRFMYDLATELDVTVSLATFMNGSVLVLQREYPKSGITRIVMNQQVPAYCTGIGKMLLSTLNSEDLQEYIDKTKLEPFTSRTLHTAEALRAALTRARENNYAEDYCEINESLHCVAILVPSLIRSQQWAMSASGSCTTIQQIGVATLVTRLHEAAASMTFSM